ncbi:hypothetical protein Mal4_51960 [Maioricimonas rarisocia]|uniref:Glycosyl hydrolase family 32 N-terminal domain-containing protein n=1 Tax=Maioricimonas rarisocia TaxID=2528026 RepID=A0A517ZEC5_9PLAN|nr:hypothetical protein [Maioricimonas rarisocia]QDU40833.1 hypothetical protein Mal4_51960 [Maioricimonas rarisocia]
MTHTPWHAGGIARCFGLVALLVVAADAMADEPVDIGSRRELFVDRVLIDQTDNVQLRLHHPVKAPRPKSPLPTGAYITVIRDSDEHGVLLRAYWRGFDPAFKGKRESGDGAETVCYAESRDGHEWTFPKLGLHQVGGTRENNVILAKMPALLHNFSPFLDTRPGVPADQRFKALAGHPGPGDKRGKARPGIGLFAFHSADGIHWTNQGEVIPYRNEWRHAFDSQNVAFWSEAEEQYVCYFRTWTEPDRLRSISRTTSKDFRTWTRPVEMKPNRSGEHLYTNQTHPYFRAPHIYVALPTRYVPGRGDPSASRDHNNATDVLLMTSRAGSTRYDRTFGEAFIRPGTDAAAWLNRANYVALNVIPTSPAEMSIYHRSGDRYVLRTDGFASVHAGAESGELVTRPLRFRGDRLELNYSTSAAGSLRVELQEPDGTPIPHFALEDCNVIYGDEVDRTVTWKNDADLASLAGRAVRLRFVLVDCDLFSFRFDEGNRKAE